MPDLNSMNETDVRELLVRPLVQRLGYEQGTSNNVRTEVSLTYNQRVLGHKRPDRDHVMRGRADYVCEVVPYGRWTIEVKAPHVCISEEDWVQAHSYAAHPEIAAAYFMITNGRVSRIYSMLEPRTPILEWTHEKTADAWVNISNILGPDRIRARYQKERLQSGKALAVGLGSSADIVGGLLEYASYESPDPALVVPLKDMQGLRATVESGSVNRTEAGLIRARLRLNGPTAVWDRFNRMVGIDGYEFETADEYISSDPEQPNILQGLLRFELPAGTPVQGLPGMPPGVDRLPIGFRASAFTQATGFLSGNRMSGVFSVEYTFTPAILGAKSLPPMRSNGDFWLTIV